jgi:predicted Zn-dependent protease
MKRLVFAVKVLTLMFLFVVLAIACAINPVTGKKQLMLMSEEQEIQLGREYDPQVVASFGEYNDPELVAFVQEKGAEIGKISHRPGIEYHVKILDSPVVNAFAVPGGYVYLTRGILAQLNNEAELAGVIGHEIGHITARHTVSQQSKQQLGQLLLIGGIIASEEFRKYADYAMQGMQLLFLKFSRDDETEADRLGVEYSSKIGYDAHKMADFFQVLNKMNMASDNAGVPTFLSTHPDPGDRYNAVNLIATEWQQTLNLPEYKVNQDSYLKMIDGIVYGEDPRQGYTDGNIFYHPELKFMFRYPEKWLLENSPLQVRTAPEDGRAMLIFTLSQGTTLEGAAQDAIDQLGLTLTDSRKTTVNGMPAIAALSKQVSQDETTGEQNTIEVLSYFIDYGGKYYVFHGVSAEADFTTYSKTLEGVMTSFNKLTAPARLNVKPKRVIIRKVEKAGTLTNVLRYYGVPQEKMEELALLNNIELTENVPAGKLIKIIGQ